MLQNNDIVAMVIRNSISVYLLIVKLLRKKKNSFANLYFDFAMLFQGIIFSVFVVDRILLIMISKDILSFYNISKLNNNISKELTI